MSLHLQRILAGLGGILLALILLEGGLRAFGGAFLFAQTVSHRMDPRRPGVIRIVCLGESTTALGGSASWPAQLEEILNQRAGHGRYSVLNAGMPAAHSEDLVDRMQQDLGTLAPDIVVAMMGANDVVAPLTEGAEAVEPGWLPRGSRTVRLFQMVRFMGRHPDADARGPAEPLGTTSDPWYTSSRAAEVFRYDHRRRYGRHLFDQGRYAEAAEQFHLASGGGGPTNVAEAAFFLALALQRLERPEEARHWLDVAVSSMGAGGLVGLAVELPRRTGGDLTLALAVARSAVEAHPEAPDAWRALARAAEAAGQAADARAAWKRVDALRPDDEEAALGVVRASMAADPTVARERLQAFLARHPGSIPGWCALARVEREAGRWDAVRGALDRARVLGPDVETLTLLAGLAEHDGRRDEARRLLETAVQQDPGDCSVVQRLLKLLLADGQRQEARLILTQPASPGAVCRQNLLEAYLGEDRLHHSGPRLQRAYARLFGLLAPRGVRLLAVQYPTVPASELEAVLPHDHVTLVDNEAIFLEAIQRDGYDAIFADRCYGFFGHGTARGNRILAERVADAILPL